MNSCRTCVCIQFVGNVWTSSTFLKLPSKLHCEIMFLPSCWDHCTYLSLMHIPTFQLYLCAAFRFAGLQWMELYCWKYWNIGLPGKAHKERYWIFFVCLFFQIYGGIKALCDDGSTAFQSWTNCVFSHGFDSIFLFSRFCQCALAFASEKKLKSFSLLTVLLDIWTPPNWKVCSGFTFRWLPCSSFSTSFELYLISSEHFSIYVELQ